MYDHLIKPENWPPNVARRPDGRLDIWVCDECAHNYDPVDGEPDWDIPPGIPFEALPETFICPECGAEKDLFFR
ncbi:MAG: rubredoxin [Rhodospirillales bacterium]|nr:rubredoxin [Rhodospirillales bacterium]